jgi:hypothetical protein
MKRFLPGLFPLSCILVMLMTSSCATVFNGSRQKVTITSNPAGAEVYLNGKNTGFITPCEIKVKRKVKAGPDTEKNVQHYVLKKDGYHDYELKDRRHISTGATIGNSAAGLLGGMIIGGGYYNEAEENKTPGSNTEDSDNIAAGYIVGIPFLLGFPVDMMTGALNNYQKNINVNMVKKEREVIVLNQDSTVLAKDNLKLANVYAVIIGVSNYKDSKMNLQYADDDANLFYDFLRSPFGGAVPEKNITLLLNENATRANIIKAVNNQFRNAFEEDVVIVYVASHGMPSALGDELYFLGSDTDRDNLEGTGVSQYDIQKALNNCRSQKKIWVSDACHSGSVGTSGVMMRGEEEKAASNMVNRLLTNVASHDKNLIMLTASSAGETSQEAKEWGGGHGVFTHYFVEGLKGAADENKNGLVDIREAYEYVRMKVSQETKKKQYPELKGVYNNKFPMSVVKARD